MATPPGAAAQPAVKVPMAYTGPGSSATGVKISPRSVDVFGGDPFAFTAQAVDGSGNPVPGTPIVWASLDESRAVVSSPTDGSGMTLETAGSVRIVARLLTGPADTAVINLQRRPRAIEIISGGGQTGEVGRSLPNPAVVRVTFVDGTGAAGVAVQFSPSAGGSVSTTTVNTDANGLARATWTLGPNAGAQALTAAVDGLAGSPVTFSATARSVAPVSIDFVVQPPASVSAGAAFGPVTITAIDAHGARAKSFSGDITLALAGGSPTASLSGALTATAVDGVATFANLKVNAAGNAFTLVASAATLGNAASTPFNVTAGTARRLIFVDYPVSGGQSGVALGPVTVRAEDGAGNLVANFADAVTLGLAENPPGAAVAGTATATSVTGVTTFTGIKLGKVGTYRFSATADGIPTVSGSQFNVTAGPAAAIALVKGDAQTAPALSPLDTIVVRVTDLGGNPVSGAAVNFGVTAGGGALSVTGGISNVAGEVSTRWTLGPAAGTQTMTAASTGMSGSPITISATATSTAAGAVASTAVTLRLDSLTSIGDVLSLSAVAHDANLVPVAGRFTWSSRSPAVVTVSAAGVVRAVTNGATYVVATEAGGTRDSSLIVVQQRLATIDVTPSAQSIYLKQHFTFSASAVDRRGVALSVQPTITWSSANTSVATVNASGLASAVGLGSTKIRATSGAVTGTAELNVLKAADDHER